MHLRKITLAGAFGLRRTTVELPERGIVVVTGPNGAGKSSLFVEAPCVALWGKTLRGTPPWSPQPPSGTEGPALVAAEFDGLEVVRVPGDGATRPTRLLGWHAVDDGTVAGCALDALARLGSVGGVFDAAVGGGTTFETPTKAQAALTEVVGSFDLWRRTRVFSSSDAAHFSLATDAERKRLLEQVVGVAGFDDALERCRGDLRAQNGALGRAQQEAALAERDLEHQRSLLAAAQRAEALAAEDEPVLSGRAAAELAALARSARDDLADANKRLGDQERTVGRARALASEALRQVTALEGREGCPTCGQGIADAHRERLRAVARELAGAATRAADDAHLARSGIDGEIAELLGEVEALERRLKVRRGLETEHARWTEARRVAAGAVAVAQEALTERVADHAAALGVVRAAELACLTLGAVDEVLGVKGVRARVLGRALPGIELLANGWLSRLRLRGLAVALRPYAVTKGGGVSDSVSLEVLGAGGGHGYRAASQGERRRIDVALLLSLSEVSAAASGLAAGTLFFDEVADGVDEDGIDAVCDLLAELAQDRAVVVVTHREELAAALPAARRYRVEAGAVEEV